MKNIIVLSLALTLTLSYGFSQSKIYNISKSPKKKSVKGTFTEIKVPKDEKLLGAGTIAATVGSAFVNAGVGLLRNSLERKKELATISVSTGPVSIDITKEVNFQIITSYYERKNDVAPKSMRNIDFQISFKSDEGILITQLEKMTSEYTQAFIKNKRNMLIYEVTLNGKAHYTNEKKKNEIKDFSTSFLFVNPSANSVFTNKMVNNTFLPKSATIVTITATVKEVNPFYNNGLSLAKFLENYGENISDLIVGLIIEKEEE